MSVENIDLEAMTEVWNNWAEINRTKDAEIRKLKEANSGSVINARLKRLKEENEKLQEEKHKVIQDAYECHYETWKKEQENITITELKEEIEILKIQEEIFTTRHMKSMNEIMELKKINVNLGEKKKKLLMDYMDKIMELKEEIDYLKNGIEEMKKDKPPVQKPKKTITCSSCGEEGHNKASKKCPNQNQ